MVVPCLRGHLDRHHETYKTNESHEPRGFLLQLGGQQVANGSHTHTTPDGEGIERTGVCIVTLTGLDGRLVQIEHDGQAGHEEQEEHDPELLDALLSLLH